MTANREYRIRELNRRTRQDERRAARTAKYGL